MDDYSGAGNPFGVAPYHASYFLPYTYEASPNQTAFRAQSGGKSLQNAEAKFQISLRVPLWTEILGRDVNLYAAYTQLSFWQAYNGPAGNPLRETDYEPETFLAFLTDRDVLGLRSRAVLLGAEHQSNGRGTESGERSWDRLYAEFVLSRGNFALTAKPWWRVPERSSLQNNPDIGRYMGYAEIRARYAFGAQEASLLLRDNLRGTGSNKGAVELDWSGPLVRRLRWYLQYFNGYGESLIDYNHASQRAGAGILFADWL